MAIGKTAAAGLALALGLGAAEFPMRHEHLRKGCAGTFTVDGDGVRFAGPKGHKWAWKYEDIQRLTLRKDSIEVVTYRDSKLRLGADVAYRFTGAPPAEALYREWSEKLDQRFVAGVVFGVEGERVPAKLLAMIQGSQGALTFAADAIAWQSPREARTWRYRDIRSVASADPFHLTITTFERQFDFQLKQAMDEPRYNRLWLDIERKNRRLQ